LLLCILFSPYVFEEITFKKYLDWSVKYPDKKKLNPNNYLPIWSCTFTCGEPKAHSAEKLCNYSI